MTHFDWSPAIGDPTIGGWIIFALYLVATISCWICARTLSSFSIAKSQERQVWRAISILFLALGVNKQLDLQTALTAAGRSLAYYQGWYEQRQIVQLVFFAMVATTCMLATITLLIWMRSAPASTWLAFLGMTLVVGYVLIRAASFNHIDRFMVILGVRGSWVLEMGGIGLVILGSLWRQWSSRRESRLYES